MKVIMALLVFPTIFLLDFKARDQYDQSAKVAEVMANHNDSEKVSKLENH